MKTYDAKKVVATLAGIILPGGFAEDDGIKVTPTEPERWQTVVGQDGEVVRSLVNDSRAKVILAVQQTSDTNDILSRLLAQDMLSRNGQGVGAFQLVDLNGNTLVRSPSAWVSGYPEIVRGKTVKVNNWTLELADCTMIIGGNTVTP